MSKSTCRTSAKEGDESSSTLGRVDVEIMTLPRASLRSRWGWALTLEGPTTKEKLPGLAALPEDVSDRKGECRVPAGTKTRYHGGSNNQCHLLGGVGQEQGKGQALPGKPPHRPWRIIGIIITVPGGWEAQDAE